MRSCSPGYSLLFAFSVIMLPLRANAFIIHVPGDYPTIRQGIAAALDGDTVLVGPGTYVENLDIDGLTVNIMSEAGPENTILQQYYQGIPIAFFSVAYTGELSGFQLQLADNGPAVWILASSPIIRDNIFVSNNAGAIVVDAASSALIENNVFVNNESPGGAGVYCNYSSAEIRGNVFISNTVSNNGGGIYMYEVTGSAIHHNVFYLNHSGSYGGAIGLNQCHEVEIYNNTIASNSSGQMLHGGGIGLLNSNENYIYNNIVVGNVREGIYQSSGFTNHASYNDVWDNTVDYYGIEPGVGAISTDPIFVGGVPFDFHLRPDSPCINAGDPESPPDPDGTIADMGAFFHSQGPGPSFDIGEAVGEPSNSVNLPVIAYRLDNVNISGLEFHVNYDYARLEYAGFTTDFLEDALVNVENGLIHLIWDDYQNPLSIPDSSVLMELRFVINGEIGDSCYVDWLDGSEIIDPFGEPIAGVSYLDGFVRVEDIVGVHDDLSQIPDSHYLGGNYPNPFNGNTAIEFGVARESHVRLAIYDILGRRVSTPIGRLYSAGRYSFIWNSVNNPSGTYFYKIQIDEYSEIGKMTLLK